MTTITDRRMPRGRAISVLSLAVWWAKLEKNDKVRHNMTQIASLLAVATVFVDLWAPFYRGLIRETKVPMQEPERSFRSLRKSRKIAMILSWEDFTCLLPWVNHGEILRDFCHDLIMGGFYVTCKVFPMFIFIHFIWEDFT